MPANSPPAAIREEVRLHDLGCADEGRLPECGQTMFKRRARALSAVLHQPACSRFVPEDQRGYVKKKTTETAEEDAESAEAADAAETAQRRPPPGRRRLRRAPPQRKRAQKRRAPRRPRRRPPQRRKRQRSRSRGCAEKPAKRRRQRRPRPRKRRPLRRRPPSPQPKRRGERRELMQVTVIGAGLAGCEAAWQLAQRGIAVTLHEMKPEKTTPRTTRRILPSFAARIRCARTRSKTRSAFSKRSCAASIR